MNTVPMTMTSQAAITARRWLTHQRATRRMVRSSLVGPGSRGLPERTYGSLTRLSSAWRMHFAYSSRCRNRLVGAVGRTRGAGATGTSRGVLALDDSGLVRDDNELDPVARAEFHQNPRHMRLRRER